MARAARAGRACKQGRIPSNVSVLAYCLQVWEDNPSLPPGVPGDTAANVQECEEVCSKILRSDAYKKNCDCVY